jgi:hypothetical protein
MGFDSVAMDKRILAGDDGEGVLITEIKLKEMTKNTGELKARLVLSGQATAVLNNQRDPSAGTTALDGAVLCEDGVDVEQADKQLFIDKVNRLFGVEPPLVDDEEGTMLYRLVEGGDAYQQIVGKKAYFQVNHRANSENTRYGAEFYTNLFSAPAVKTATKDNLTAVLAKLRAKQDAKTGGKADADRVLADVLG